MLAGLVQGRLVVELGGEVTRGAAMWLLIRA